MAGTTGAADDVDGEIPVVATFCDDWDEAVTAPLGVDEAAGGGVPPGGFLATSVLILLQPEPANPKAGRRTEIVSALAKESFMSATNQEHRQFARVTRRAPD